MGLIVSHNSNRVTCTDENWMFHTKDRNHMEYIENNHGYLIEVEYCMPPSGFLILIYFDTIKPIDNDTQLCETSRERIKKRVKLALDAMGDKYEFC